MLSREGNESGEKTAIGLIRKQLCTCSTLFLVHFFAVVLHDYNVKLPETFMEEMSYVFLFTFFYVAHFHSGDRKHFSFPHRHYKISCCSSNKKCFLCFFSLALALFLVELRWPVALLSLFVCLSLSLYSKFVDMTINVSLIL